MVTIYEKPEKEAVIFSKESEMFFPLVFARMSTIYRFAFREFYFKDFSNYRFPHIADVCFWSGQKAIAYELKLTDWKKVLKQAVINAKNFSFSGICMLDKVLSKHFESKMKKTCKEFNIEVVSLFFNKKAIKQNMDFKSEGDYIDPVNINRFYFLKYYNRFNYKKPNNVTDEIKQRADALIPTAVRYQNGIEVIRKKWIPFCL